MTIGTLQQNANFSGEREAAAFRTAYHILQQQGRGGMSEVFLAEDLATSRLAIVKKLAPECKHDPVLIERFRAEGRTLAALNHPNIVQLYGVFDVEGERTIVMEFIDGVTLSSAAQTTIPIVRCLDIGAQILSALVHCHGRGIVHRDLKPTNIMIAADGMVKLIDFGISKRLDSGVTLPGCTLGTVRYMSPEQTLGLNVDSRSDLYSVGVLLFELMTHRRPFVGDTPHSLMQHHVHTRPAPPILLNPQIPKSLSDIILIALEKEPARRFQTAESFAEMLSLNLPFLTPACLTWRIAQFSV